MEKTKLMNFISKYNLGGNVESVIWEVQNGEFNVRFITDNTELLAEIKMKNLSDVIKVNGKDMNGEVAKLGVYTTSQLIKLLGIFEKDVSLSLLKVDRGRHGEAYGSINFSDDTNNIDYMLTETSVIRPAKELNQLPEFQLNILLDKKFTKAFIKGHNALPDNENFTVIATSNTVKVVLGQRNVNTNRVTIKPELDGDSSEMDLSFSAIYLKEILSANSEFEHAVLRISEDGLAMVEFTTDDFDARYFLVARHD